MSDAMNQPKLQHYLPQAAVLRPFAAGQKLTLRRRGAAPVPTTVRSAGAENHLYSIVRPDGTKDTTVEEVLATVDGLGKEALDGLRAGNLPNAGTDERHAVALFMGLLLARSPEHQAQYLLARRVVDYCGVSDPTRGDVRAYLRNIHLGFEPRGDPEVEAAWNLVSYSVHQLGLPSKAEALRSMFELGVHNLAPAFEQMTWSLEICRKPRFATCDRLPAIWKRPSAEDSYLGVGIVGAEEIWLPLSPTHLLVLERGGNEQIRCVEPKRARFVNMHLAKHCTMAVVHHPELPTSFGDFPMQARKVTTRFWMAPGFDAQGAPLGNDIIQMWTPIRDDA